MMTQNNSFNDDQIIQKQKKSWLISTVVIAICCAVMLVGVIATFGASVYASVFFILALFVPSLIATIYFIRTYKTRSDSDWIIDYIESKHLSYTPEGIELLKRANVISDSIFVVSKIVDITASRLSATKLLIDNQNKKFVYQKGKTYSKVYNFKDIISYEVYENGKIQVQGRAGAALVGGAFFGLGGLIAGSSMKRNVNEVCNQLKLIIRLNDFDCTQIVIEYNAGCDKNSLDYEKMRSNLQSVCSMIEYMINEKNLDQSTDTIKNKEETSNMASSKVQLQELKEMLDSGLITQEDYEKKKKQILGL